VLLGYGATWSYGACIPANAAPISGERTLCLVHSARLRRLEKVDPMNLKQILNDQSEEGVKMIHIQTFSGTLSPCFFVWAFMRTQLISCRLPKADSGLLRSSLLHFVSSSSVERGRGSPFAEASDPGGSRNGSTEMRS
jgi:hypothetical protein